MSDATDRSAGGGGAEAPGPSQPHPSILELVEQKTGEVPRVTLRDEDSAAVAAPVIDPGSQEKTSVPQGRSNYQFLGEIARGGMGVIIKGHDTDLGRDVAVKVLDKRLADHADVVQRFVEEAQIGGQLQHPGIVPVYELGMMEDQRPYFSMKLVKGRTLATLLSERESPTKHRRRLVDVFEAICQTMAYAHSRGVIHRDLKPANIMVGAFGEVQVVDWGLAKVLARGGTADEKRARQAHSNLTVLETIRSSEGSGSDSGSMVGSVMGTPAYMPPEQASGHVDRADERSDVFALGAILCEILTGLPPYVGERDEVVSAAAQAECDGALERLDASGADPELIKLAKHCLLPAQAARPANAGVVAERVHEYIVSVEERAHEALVESAAAKVRVEQERKARKLTLALGVSVAAILLVGGSGFSFVQSERAAREREEAARMQEEAQRDAELSADVNDALAAAASHEGGGRWTEAIQSAARARALAEGGGASEELVGRVDVVLADLHHGRDQARLLAEREADNRRLLTELLEVREPDWVPNRDSAIRLARDYEDTFRSHGIDLDRGSVEDVAAALEERGFGSEIALVLDSLVEARRRSGDRTATVRVLEIAHAVDPDPVRADLREALAAGELEVLRWIVESGFKDQPPITIEVLGSAFQQLDQRDSAWQVYRAGIERYPADFSLQYRLGRLLTPPELNPGVPDEMEEAIECYRAALALRPDSTVVRYYLGRLYTKLDEYERSNEQYAIALEQRPDDGTFLYHTASNLFRMGQVSRALTIYESLAERTRPAWLEAWVADGIGRCLRAQGDVAGSVEAFERAVAANPGQDRFHANLFESALMTGSEDEQQRVLRRTLEQFPTNATAHNNMAWALATAQSEEARDLDEAIRLAQRSIELEDSDAAWNTLGVALYYAGDFEGALEALLRSLALQGSGNVVDWLFLAMSHKALGNEIEARSWYQRAVFWMEEQPGTDPENVRFRAEADAVMR